MIGDLQGPILFERMKFSVGGVFPMTIFKHQPEMPVQKPYVEMARLVASRHGIPTSPTFARPLKVVLAARQAGEERFLSNAQDLAKVGLGHIPALSHQSRIGDNTAYADRTPVFWSCIADYSMPFN